MNETLIMSWINEKYIHMIIWFANYDNTSGKWGYNLNINIYFLYVLAGFSIRVFMLLNKPRHEYIGWSAATLLNKQFVDKPQSNGKDLQLVNTPVNTTVSIPYSN